MDACHLMQGLGPAGLRAAAFPPSPQQRGEMEGRGGRENAYVASALTARTDEMPSKGCSALCGLHG